MNTQAFAVCGQATYEIAEDLRLTLGARYSSEKKKALYNFLFDVVTPFGPNTSAALVLQPPAGTISLPGQKRFNSFTPRVALDYQVTPDMLLYASWSHGVKSGTYIGRASCRERVCHNV